MTMIKKDISNVTPDNTNMRGVDIRIVDENAVTDKIHSTSDFRYNKRCHTLREHENWQFSAPKNVQYDNAVIAKEIIKGYFKGEYQTGEFQDLVDEAMYGLEEDTEENKLRKQKLVKCLVRAVTCEHRTPTFVKPKIMTFDDYTVKVKPDVAFIGASEIEVVMYKAGKPNIAQKGRKTDASANNSLELYFLLCYARTLLQPGETKIIKASYYFLRKDTDTKTNGWDPEFFSGKGGNVVTLEELYKYGQTEPTDYDKSFAVHLEEFAIGKDDCDENDCKACSFKVACKYQKTPEVFERKTLSSKAGKITPSDAQQQIIDFRKGVCRVNATAGAGKTECMTERGAQMISEGVMPEEILFITFTDAGAIEMRERITKKLISRNLFVDGDKIQAMTFNTFAYRIVRDKFADCGFTKAPIVIDNVRNSKIVAQMINENIITSLDYGNFGVDMPNCRGALACAIKVFDEIKTENLDPNEPNVEQKLIDIMQSNGFYRFMSNTAIAELVDLYSEYDKRLKEDNLLQFSDQEPLMNKVLELYPDYLEQYGYKHIIVDEFQDSNDVQLATISKLVACKSFESLMVVGDDSQSIYGFRKTSPENILHFFDKLGIQGIDMMLTDNRRSTPQILELANKINDLNTEKVDKAMNSTREDGQAPIVNGFHSKTEEYNFIADQIKRLIDEQGYIPEDIAFIAATKAELVSLATELSKRNVPWVMKNPMPLMENSRVLAALSLAEAFWQPEVESIYFNYLVAKYDGEIMNMPLDEVRREINEMKAQFSGFATSDLPLEYQRMLFHQYLEAIMGNDEIYQHFLGLVYNNEDIQSELEYIQDFKKFGEKEAKKMEQTYAGVVLTTAHSSKGLEWPVVFNSVSKYDNTFFHLGNAKKKIKEIEEKRRLLFVSITRARDVLYVTGQYICGGTEKEGYLYNQFLREVIEQSGQVYNPIDPMADFKKEEAKKKRQEAYVAKKAASKATLTKSFGKTMSEEDKKKYDEMTKNSQQLNVSNIAL